MRSAHVETRSRRSCPSWGWRYALVGVFGLAAWSGCGGPHAAPPAHSAVPSRAQPAPTPGTLPPAASEGTVVAPASRAEASGSAVPLHLTGAFWVAGQWWLGGFAQSAGGARKPFLGHVSWVSPHTLQWQATPVPAMPLALTKSGPQRWMLGEQRAAGSSAVSLVLEEQQGHRWVLRWQSARHVLAPGAAAAWAPRRIAARSAIAFPTATQGWALIDNQLWHSADGGRQWTRATTRPVRALACAPGVCLRLDHDGIARWTVGGTWQRVTTLSAATQTILGSPGAHPTGFLQLDAHGKGVALWVGSAGTTAGNPWALRITHDGGRHWRPVSGATLPGTPHLPMGVNVHAREQAGTIWVVGQHPGQPTPLWGLQFRPATGTTRTIPMPPVRAPGTLGPVWAVGPHLMVSWVSGLLPRAPQIWRRTGPTWVPVSLKVQ